MKKTTLLIIFLCTLICPRMLSQVSENRTDRAAVQFIHNAADVALTSVDVYVDGKLVADGLTFRSATGFLEIPADVPVRIDIAPDSSTSASASIYAVTATFLAGSANIAITSGYVSTSGYQSKLPFQLMIFDQARVEANVSTTTDVLIMDSEDISQINIIVPATPGGNINQDVFYRPSAAGYYELIPAQYQIKVTSADNQITTMYRLPVSALRLNGMAITIIPSGFIYPGLNGNGPEFGLYVALANGGALIPLDLVADNVLSFADANILMHPNPAVDFLHFEFPFATRNINAQIVDIMGREIRMYSNIDNRIDISDLINGVYTINLIIDNKNYTEKFVKNF